MKIENQTQPARIRVKKSHQEMFGVLGVAHGTVEYCVKNDKLELLRMLSQISSLPEIYDEKKFVYGEFAEKINDVAESFGCWVTECPPILLNQEFDGKVAYITVLNMIERSLYKFDNKRQLQQLVEPIDRLFEALTNYGILEPILGFSKERMVARYVLAAQMTYRNSAKGLAELDEQKAINQAEKSWERLIAESVFAKLHSVVQHPLYGQVIANLGAQHAHTQARSHNTLSRERD
jgi:hypothetical protein